MSEYGHLLFIGRKHAHFATEDPTLQRMVPLAIDQRSGSAPGVMHLVQFFHPLFGDVCVNLCRRKICMTQQQLDNSQIRAMI